MFICYYFSKNMNNSGQQCCVRTFKHLFDTVLFSYRTTYNKTLRIPIKTKMQVDYNNWIGSLKACCTICMVTGELEFFIDGVVP